MSLLISGGVLACTCAAYDVDVGHMWGAIRWAVGLGWRSTKSTSKETIVTAGNELSVDGQTMTVKKMPPEALDRRLAWSRIQQKDGWIAFRGETLEIVAAEFNQHNGRQLVMGDAATAHLLVGGKFRVTDVDGFLSALEVTHGVKAVLSPPRGRKPQVLVLIGGVSGSSYSDEVAEPEEE